MMPGDPWDDPLAQRWARDVLDNMAPKLRESAVAISLVPEDRTGDVKFWVELGATIMMDKPVIAVMLGDAPLPPRLAKIADEIVRCPHGIDPSASVEVAEAIKRVVGRLEQ